MEKIGSTAPSLQEKETEDEAAEQWYNVQGSDTTMFNNSTKAKYKK